MSDDEQKIIGFKNRDFICSCKKSYLSYAALFTHIKQKHGGKAPGPIVRPRSCNKRGRPKKKNQFDDDNVMQYHLRNDQKLDSKSQDNDQNKQQKDLQESQQVKQDSQIKKEGDYEEQNLLKKNEGFKIYRDSEYQKQYLNENKNQLNNRDNFIEKIEKISKENYEKEKLKTISQGLKAVLFQWSISDETYQQIRRQIQNTFIFNELKKIKSPSPSQIGQYNEELNCLMIQMGNGIKQFLNFVQSFVNTIQYSQIQLLIIIFLQYVGSQLKDNNKFLTEHYIYQVTCFVNNFLQFYLLNEVKRRKIQHLNILKSNNPIRILIWFFNWLTVKEYTHFKVKINPSYNQQNNLSEDKNLKKQQEINL